MRQFVSQRGLRELVVPPTERDERLGARVLALDVAVEAVPHVPPPLVEPCLLLGPALRRSGRRERIARCARRVGLEVSRAPYGPPCMATNCRPSDN